MIDDDFDKIFRRMIENFFGHTSGNTQFGFGIPQGPDTETIEAGPNIEQIDLDDKTIVIIDDKTLDDVPEVSIRGKEVIVKLGDEEKARIELESRVSTEESFSSFRNGILEITLIKNEEQKTDTDNGKYTLRNV